MFLVINLITIEQVELIDAHSNMEQRGNKAWEESHRLDNSGKASGE